VERGGTGWTAPAVNALGEHFADLLTHVTITRLLQNYELTLVTPRPVPVPTPAFKGPRSPCLIRYRAKPPVNHR
jgi:sterol 14alpha-demethylase